LCPFHCKNSASDGRLKLFPRKCAMSEHQVLTSPLQAVGNRGVLTTPTGTQSMEDLRRRRLIVLALNVSTFGLLIWAAINVLKAGGWSLVDTALLIAFAVGSPWTVLGFWNSVIGLWLLHGVRDPITKVAPYARAGDLPT